MEFILRTNNLSKNYGGKIAVNHMDMHIRKGDIYGIVGKNGAGKTTLMRMIAGMTTPTSGTIELFESENLANQRKRMGILIEGPAVYPNMTARQNLEVFRRLYGIVEKDCIDTVLNIVGLNNTGKKKAKDFSLGMRQRLGIAVSLLGNPDFIILDEPINGLDPAGVKEIRDLLLKLNAEQGITVLISSHILAELSKLASHFGIINDGILVDEFTAQELEERCNNCIRMKVDDVNHARTVLETIIGTTNYQVLPDNSIRLFDYIDQSGLINTQLVKNDIVVESITKAGQDLESYFLELTGGRND